MCADASAVIATSWVGPLGAPGFRRRMKPINQHFVPRGYLSAWACGSEPEPNWVWRLDRQLLRVDLKSPRRILREAHIYTVRDADGSEDFRFERFFQEREEAFYRVRSKLLALEPLSREEWVDLLVFTAAARVRTQLNRDRHRQQWGDAVRIGESMLQHLATMTPKARAEMAKMQPPSKTKGITLDQARRLRDEPIQTLLASHLKFLVKRFEAMQASVLFASGGARFITSDNPCVFFDQNARPHPNFGALPDIRSPTIEVTMPLSPNACFHLGLEGEGFLRLPDEEVCAINNRTAAAAARYLVSATQDGWPDFLGPNDGTLGVD